jgi:dihydrofolate synthase/folylpolyglutamate synthase
MTYEDSVQYLTSLGHETVAIKLGLEKVRLLLDRLGNPQNKFFKVQIAGTNGKGSTSAMLDAICRATKIRTALFTSPHLIDPTERIRINGEDISRDEFARLTAIVRDASSALIKKGDLTAPPSFFEHLTAIFLLAAAGAAVELAILETGLGGRLDATTATEAEVVGITSIALDHQEYLGPTLVGIAAEKAAIIRAGVSAVSAPQLPEATSVINERAMDAGVALRWADGDASAVTVEPDGRLRVDFVTSKAKYADVVLNLRGRHQLNNAATAIELAEMLEERGWPIEPDLIRTGLRSAQHSGRLEMWTGAPPFLFDGAHNPAGAAALADYLREFVTAPITLVFGAMREKEFDQILAALCPLAQSVIFTEPNSPRAATVASLRDAAPADLDHERIVLAWDVPVALQTALNDTSNEGVICVTGSLYLVGEAQSWLQSPEGELLWKRK